MSPDIAKIALVAACIAAITALALTHVVPGEAVMVAIGAVLGNASPGLLGPKPGQGKDTEPK